MFDLSIIKTQEIFKKLVYYLNNIFIGDFFVYNLTITFFIISVLVVYNAFFNNIFKKAFEISNKENVTRTRTRIFSDILLFAQEEEDYKPKEGKIVKRLYWDEAMARKKAQGYKKKWYPWRSDSLQSMTHKSWFLYILVSQGSRFFYFLFLIPIILHLLLPFIYLIAFIIWKLYDKWEPGDFFGISCFFFLGFLDIFFP